MGSDNTKNYYSNEQIISYYIFHKKIEQLIKDGFNPFPDSYMEKPKIENLYIINGNLINTWKCYSGYEIAKDALDSIPLVDKKQYKYLLNNKLIGLINQEIISNKYYNFYGYGDIHGDYYIRFISNYLKIETLDWLIDEKTYKKFNFNKASKIKGIISNIMMVLLFKEQFLMKFIYHGKIEGNNELIQLTASFIKTKNGDVDMEKSEKNFKYFSEALEKYNSNLIMQLFNRFNIDYVKEVEISFEKNLSFHLRNENLFLKYTKENSIKNITEINFKNANNLRLIGLANVGATCYMNATLQCFINVNLLTKYLLNTTIYNKIKDNIEICQLTNAYCRLLFQVCCNENIQKYYEPTEFKDFISWKNPLFKGVNANDSKDLINFMLEEMNHELSNLTKADINIKKNFNQIDQTRSDLVLKNFKEDFIKNNKSIISKTFFFIIEVKSQCKYCSIIKYNYQALYLLEFPLETVYKFCLSKNINPINKNGEKYLTLIQCFEHYKHPSLFTGENSFYCNACKGQRDSFYYNNIYSLPPTLIIILNRGKGKAFDCYIDFPETLSLQQYVISPNSSTNYHLRGVISHLGKSGMSGHFIAFCKNRINNSWYRYNDSMVTYCNDQKNEFRIGTPYILFYESGNNKNVLFDDISKSINNNGFNKNMNDFNIQNFKTDIKNGHKNPLNNMGMNQMHNNKNNKNMNKQMNFFNNNMMNINLLNMNTSPNNLIHLNQNIMNNNMMNQNQNNMPNNFNNINQNNLNNNMKNQNQNNMQNNFNNINQNNMNKNMMNQNQNNMKNNINNINSDMNRGDVNKNMMNQNQNNMQNNFNNLNQNNMNNNNMMNLNFLNMNSKPNQNNMNNYNNNMFNNCNMINIINNNNMANMNNMKMNQMNMNNMKMNQMNINNMNMNQMNINNMNMNQMNMNQMNMNIMGNFHK